MKIEHRGSIRGGSNEYARLFLHICPPNNPSEPELQVYAENWTEEFGFTIGWADIGQCTFKGSTTICFKMDNRRHFAIIPAMIRKAERIGWDVAISQWDTACGHYENESKGLQHEHQGFVRISHRPMEFWREIALAQMFFGS